MKKDQLPVNQPDEKEQDASVEKCFLTLFNDDVNPFDFVIGTLVEVCLHDIIQAEQCAFIAHHKGKCEVKTGTEPFLRPMLMELRNRGLTAEIN